MRVRFPLGAHMFANHKKAYGWFALLMILLGLTIFVFSLVAAMSSSKITLHEQGKSLYFNRKILPDHVFYPFLMIVNRLELETSNEVEKIILRAEYAQKRLDSTKGLLEKEKKDLAYVTLGKAHQYLLRANQDSLISNESTENLAFIRDLNQKFMQEYESLKSSFDDAQQSRLQVMIEELKVFNTIEKK